MEALARGLEELARALDRAGAPPDAAGRLLELASAAALQAVALDEGRRTAATRPAATVEVFCPEPPVGRAALRRAA